MTLTFGDFTVVTILSAIVAFLSAEWTKIRLQNSVKHEYDKKLEDFKFDVRKREQASRVAKLLAMATDPAISSREFNELAWELSLWLPKDLVWELTRCLCNDPGAMNIKEILIQVRKVLNGVDDGLEAGQLLHRLPDPIPMPASVAPIPVMELYMASQREFVPAQKLARRTAPSRGHLKRIEDPSWREIERVLESARNPGEISREIAYFASASVADCGLYMQKQIVDPFTGERTGPQAIYYYKIEMPNPTKAVMALYYRCGLHLGEQQVLESICAEYWRQPKIRWNWFEYLGEECTIIEAVAGPTQEEVDSSLHDYTSDVIAARNTWPETRPKPVNP